MDQDAKIRAAAEAANQTASGFLHGAGWAAGAAAIGLIALHPVIVAGAVVATGAAFAAKWRGPKTLGDSVDSVDGSLDGTGQPATNLPGLFDSVRAKVRERVKGSAT
jgi:hypothetical protein